MVSVAIPPLSSFKWPPALNFFDDIPANFGDLITLYHQLWTFLRSDSGVSIILFILYSAGTFLAITSPAWLLLYSVRKKRLRKRFVAADGLDDRVNGGSPEWLIEGRMARDGIIGERASAACTHDLMMDDALYAEEFQLYEACLASLYTSVTANNDPSSSLQGPTNQAENPPQSFCEICLEDKDSWQMFTNNSCSHSFCYNCTASHVVTKIQEKVNKVSCPALNCKATLNYDACRLMIPGDALVQWDELLCMSLIPDSQKLYCPFRDCAALLVNDSGLVTRKIDCVVCKRSFCAECRVPWHSDFTCKEYMKLYAKKGGNDDKIVKLLAKKKKWQKCPKCKMYVEKSDGCVHMTCRCKYEFCYRCGSKWSDSHGNCKPKS